MLVGGVLGLVVIVFIFLSVVLILLRVVVPTNEVHIVQSSHATTSYGKDTENGNAYYAWPSWVPVIGITKITLPMSIFDLDLIGYEAYDKGRLPFVVDVKAFFRVADSNAAAQRVSSFTELKDQLRAVVQGAVRVILASSEIEDIMQGRSKFGDEFTKEVNGQLKSWGVETVKNIELMDLRDHKDSYVIKNIMEKKKSHIEMESRIEVAKNHQMAKIAEIEAEREVEVQTQAASQAVGLRTIEAEKTVAIQEQEKIQAIKNQERLTKEKEMEVIRVQHIKQAEIQKDVAVTIASQEKETIVIRAQGSLEAKEREAKGIAVEGQAKADAEKAMQLAPVEAQIVLAKEIGGNQAYQNYLVTIKKVDADQAIGIEQARSISKADIKIIANAGSIEGGLKSTLEIFSSKGGTEIGAMLEGFKNTPVGEKIINAIAKDEK